MSKERIESIKNRIDPNKWRDGLHLNIKEEIEWLIEQAERVQELEEQLQGMHIMYDTRLAKSDEFEKQNKRYREALEEIKRLWERSTDATDDTNLAWKMSCEAHKALEESE